MKVWNTVFRILAPIAIFAGAEAYATGPAPMEPILIKKILTKGSGCPDASTVAVNIANDKQAFTVSFSEFLAETGPGIPLSDSRKNCNVTLVLNIPSGWQYSVADFLYRGYIFLDKGIKAEHNTQYSFEGQPRTGSFASTTNGQFDNEYVYWDQIGISSQIWSPCTVNRAMNINVSVRVHNTNNNKYPQAQGMIVNDSVDGDIQQKWGLT